MAAHAHAAPTTAHGARCPKGLPLGRVRLIRDDIRRRVERLVTKEGWARVIIPDRG
jgi:hypothetical protein